MIGRFDKKLANNERTIAKAKQKIENIQCVWLQKFLVVSETKIKRKTKTKCKTTEDGVLIVGQVVFTGCRQPIPSSPISGDDNTDGSSNCRQAGTRSRGMARDGCGTVVTAGTTEAQVQKQLTEAGEGLRRRQMGDSHWDNKRSRQCATDRPRSMEWRPDWNIHIWKGNQIVRRWGESEHRPNHFCSRANWINGTSEERESAQWQMKGCCNEEAGRRVV